MFTEVQNCGSRLEGSTEEAAILRRWAKLKSKLKRLFENCTPSPCLSPLELCQYILAKGVRKHGSKALF